ncbi:TetR/AcrR family transcriptional regulator C-terminal domain-containing protein [Bradyrhizobium yuanmingense]|uniref:TetR/AcrR family transcriptional regulator C-terminal domain-containing protein n=1 Tax=Bradyrhizobium yuanmingense TaxID=108015 RepID=UPI001FD42A71|nr:TetR/AcrR family transcriptional regulator C-terminal domain-containing protein [Bradyrhizobium yuanmingense]
MEDSAGQESRSLKLMYRGGRLRIDGLLIPGSPETKTGGNRHFENKEALFGAAIAAGCQLLFAPQALLEGDDGSVEDQLMTVGSLLLRTLLRPDVRSVEAMVMADKTNQTSLSKLHFEAGPAHVIGQIEALLRQLHAKALLNVPDPHRSARLFAALFKGSDLVMIARFDQARAEDKHEIESYCRSAGAMFIAGHGVGDDVGAAPKIKRQNLNRA